MDTLMKLVKNLKNGALKQLNRKEEKEKVKIVKDKEQALWRSLVKPA